MRKSGKEEVKTHRNGSLTNMQYKLFQILCKLTTLALELSHDKIEIMLPIRLRPVRYNHIRHLAQWLASYILFPHRPLLPGKQGLLGLDAVKDKICK